MSLRGARCPRCGMLRYPGDERLHDSCLPYFDQHRRPTTRTGPVVYFLAVCVALGALGGLAALAIGRNLWTAALLAAVVAGSWLVVAGVDAFRQLSRP